MASPRTSNGRRASLQRWLSTKTIASVEKTEQRGEGMDQEGATRSWHDQEHPGPGVDYPPGGGVLGADRADLGHSLSTRKIESNLEEDGTHVHADNNANLHERKGTVMPTTSSLSRGRRSSDNIIGSDDQPLSDTNKIANQVDDNAGIEDIYDSPVGDGSPRQVAFLSGTMGLTVDISDPMQPQPPDELREQETAHEDEAQFPASPCSGAILETSPRYGSLQIFRKEMSLRGINAQVRVIGPVFVKSLSRLSFDVRPRASCTM